MNKTRKIDPSTWGIVKLKTLLEDQGLPANGTKKQVLQRVLDNFDDDDLEYYLNYDCRVCVFLIIQQKF